MNIETFYQGFCKETFDENGVLNTFEPVLAENFNFAYDVVDEIARQEPDRRAMVWCNETGESKTIIFGLTGTGYFDMTAYDAYRNGTMSNHVPTDDELAAGFQSLPQLEL